MGCVSALCYFCSYENNLTKVDHSEQLNTFAFVESQFIKAKIYYKLRIAKFQDQFPITVKLRFLLEATAKNAK